MADYVLCFLVEGTVALGVITISKDKRVADLRTQIHASCIHGHCRDIDALQLSLLEVDIDPSSAIDIGAFVLSDVGNVGMDPLQRIYEIWPDQPNTYRVHIWVKLPRPPPPRPTLTSVFSDEMFTMQLMVLDNWDHLSQDDLHHNEVTLAESSQDLRDFQECLRRKRYIDNAAKDEYAMFQRTRFIRLPTSSNSYFESVIPPETPSRVDYVTQKELFHYASIFSSSGLGQITLYQSNKEGQVHALLLNFVAGLQSVPSSGCGSRTQLPFYLIVETPKENLKYSSRSDFHMCIKNFPHVLVKVNSNRFEYDRYRLLLQASCICRIGNWLRASTSGKPIIIMAVYIDQSYQADQYLVYQPDVKSTKVEYVRERFDLTNPQKAFEFIFQLYNFFAVAQTDNDGFHKPLFRLAEAKRLVARRGYLTISTERTSKRRECGETDNDSFNNDISDNDSSDNDSSTSGGAQGSFGDPLVQKEVIRAGYMLTKLPKDFASLTPFKPTMHKATSRSGLPVILKIIVDSNERQLLQYLTDIKAPSNHIIPLLDSIDLITIGKTIIVLPQKSTLDFAIRERPDDAVSLCLQFIEGVAFLHQHKVAHCDLKPDNVVVDTEFESRTSPRSRLFIIDLDIAQSVESEETMTEGWCGTPPWIAPELGSRDGPIQRYSPILADRWACGQIINHFAKYFPTYEGARKTWLLVFARQLLDVDPRARPELSQLQAMIDGPTKRKRATSQHEPVPKRPATNR